MTVLSVDDGIELGPYIHVRPWGLWSWEPHSYLGLNIEPKITFKASDSQLDDSGIVFKKYRVNFVQFPNEIGEIIVLGE